MRFLKCCAIETNSFYSSESTLSIGRLELVFDWSKGKGNRDTEKYKLTPRIIWFSETIRYSASTKSNISILIDSQQNTEQEMVTLTEIDDKNMVILKRSKTL